MAFTWDGPVSAQRDVTGSPVTITLTGSVSAGKYILVWFIGDSNSISLTSVTDSNGHTYTTSYSTASQGNVGLAIARVTSSMDTSDTVTITYSGSNDMLARVYACSGIRLPEDVKGNKTYTSSGNWTHTLTTTEDCVQFMAFTFPFDWGLSDGCSNATGWTRADRLDDNADQCGTMLYKEVTAGANACTGACALAYLATGIALPYSSAPTGQAIIVG